MGGELLVEEVRQYERMSTEMSNNAGGQANRHALKSGLRFSKVPKYLYIRPSSFMITELFYSIFFRG